MQERDIGIKFGKKERKLFLADDMSLCVDNPKDSTRKVLELISKLSNVAGYKINIQKSIVFV